MDQKTKREIYLKSWVYENLVSLARQCSWGVHNAKNSDMENLIHCELGSSHVGHLKGSQMVKIVKREMAGALRVAIKRPIDLEDRKALKVLLDETLKVVQSEELLPICRLGVDILSLFLSFRT